MKSRRGAVAGHARGLPVTQFLRVNAVARRYDTTASTIWRWSREKRFAHLNFPKPIELGPNTTGWSDAELAAYDTKRIAMRDGGDNTDDDDDDERPP